MRNLTYLAITVFMLAESSLPGFEEKRPRNLALLAITVLLLAESSLFAQSVDSPRTGQETGPLRMVTSHAITTVTFVPYCVDLAWQVPLGGRVGWITASVANPAPQPADARVFLLRGSGTVFSPGFGEICTRLRGAGIWTEDLGPAGDRWVCRHVIGEHRAGRLGGPIILVGHSRGARHAVDTASELERAGIVVDLVVCVDATLLPRVPANVRQALNLYISQPRIYPADTLKPAPGSTVRIDNVDLTGPDAPDLGLALCHVNVAAYRSVQDIIFERIEQVARPRPRP
jgi:hypothetical protein